MILERNEAEKLKVKFEECKKIGYKDNEPHSMDSSSYYYSDELTYVETDKVDGDKTIAAGYYRSDGKKIDSWYIYTRPTEIKDLVLVKQNDHLVDLNWFAVNCKYPFMIDQCVADQVVSVENLTNILNKIEEKTINLRTLIDSIPQANFNSKCNVHVGGGLIVTYNDLKLCENYCTDALQVELNNGWRIIAVCVQDQRRPDYVMGRYNPALDTFEKRGAERGDGEIPKVPIF